MDSRWADSTDEEDADLDAPVELSEDAIAPQEVSDLGFATFADRNACLDVLETEYDWLIPCRWLDICLTIFYTFNYLLTTIQFTRKIASLSLE